ncbi:MAG TPA: PhzF family phenazine biosynthesis protein [Thermoanaerobaculia bacterium]|nr:PhzF family phenazine biosynthesis protein [Thermoanaerobaculia bacterium]
MRHRFLTADVFTRRVFGGNPLAVFPDGRGLSEAQMRQATREMNLSETVFVLPPENPQHTRRLRIFTPETEMPFAGHPTVGTAIVLASIGEVPLTGEETSIVFEEGVGPVPVKIRAEGGVPVFAQLSAARLPAVGPPPPSAEELAGLLSLDPSDVLSGEESPENVSAGVPFLFIPVRDRAVLARCRVRLDRWDALLAGPEAPPELYVFSHDPELPGSHFRARMFAPGLGISEDPATGGAVTAFGGYVGSRAPERDGTLKWTIEQGFEMGRPSLLHLEVDKRDGEVTAVRVGGEAVLVSEGMMEIPG